MKIRKILAISLIAFTLLTGCSSGNSDLKEIGIIQFVQHPALDEAREGFIEELANGGYKDGDNIKLDYQNASGDTSNNATIASSFANDKKELVLAIATPSAQAIAQNIKNVPVLVTAVTDPESAGLVKSNEDVGGNISGTSDKAPIKRQLELLHEAFPDASKIGIIYSSSEDNSKVIFNEAKGILDEMKLTTVEATVQNSNDVQSVMQSLVGKIDVLYVPTDNVISSSMSTISDICIKNKIPIVASEESQVKNGALFTVGINYKELGKQTARMAIKILKGEMTVDKMPIEYLEKKSFAINEEVAKALDVDIDKIRKIAEK